MVMVDLARLLERFGGECGLLSGGGPDVVGVSLDSRALGAGELFAALPGQAADGARFVPQALERGASVVLSPAPLDPAPPVPNWVHPDARRVVGEVAALVHGEPSKHLFVVAVTGTNGKTTVAHLIGELFDRVGRRAAVLGTTGHRLGDERLPTTHTTPDAPQLQRLLARHVAAGGEVVALEMSSHALDQERHAGLEVDVAILTNVTRDHLDYHGTHEAYLAAKQRLFDALRPGATAVINHDDPAGERMAAAAAARGADVVRFSTRSRVDLNASRIELDPRGTLFVIDGMGIPRQTRVLSPLPGRFNVENALAALAAVLLSGASSSSALEGLASVGPAPGRLERVPVPPKYKGGDIDVFVDYAHTEDALRQVLGALREQTRGRLICVFGCGGDRDPGKRAAMGAAVGELADVAVVTSDNPRGEDPAAIVEQVLAGLAGTGAEAHAVVDRREAIAAALGLAQIGDVVLVAGKGHETTQAIGAEVLAFDDRAVAAEILAEGAR
jgi:UDP-N-acetylmuramoyl-L-alanyl-D-glutamate--2,6-diaminopimelate ligase